MHSMLFVATIPDFSLTSDRGFQNWEDFSAHATRTVGQSASVEQLARNVWLLNMRTDPLPLVLLGSAAHQRGIAFRLLPFADEPQWLPGKTSIPKTQS